MIFRVASDQVFPRACIVLTRAAAGLVESTRRSPFLSGPGKGAFHYRSGRPWQYFIDILTRFDEHRHVVCAVSRGARVVFCLTSIRHRLPRAAARHGHYGLTWEGAIPHTDDRKHDHSFTTLCVDLQHILHSLPAVHLL